MDPLEEQLVYLFSNYSMVVEKVKSHSFHHLRVASARSVFKICDAATADNTLFLLMITLHHLKSSIALGGGGPFKLTPILQ